MPTNVVLQGYNVGSDVRFAIMDQFGDVFSDEMLGLLTEFDLRSTDTKLKVTPISNGGVPVNQTLPNGLRGTMKFVRVGPSFNQLYIDLSAAYFNSGLLSQFFIAMNVRNRNGSVDEYQISGVQFSEWNFGNFRSTKEVDLNLAFEASYMNGSGSLATVLSGMG